jgi:hypothetical protein
MNYFGVDTRFDLAGLFNTLGYKTGVEIGVAKGKFSRYICDSVPGVKLYCIDLWEDDENDPWDYSGFHDEHFHQARKLLRHHNVTFMKCSSMDAIPEFEDGSLDFVYIDANHTFDYAVTDIIQWNRKVRSGGIVSGHDYFNRQEFGVITAVDAYVKEHRIDPWYLTKERVPSWFWIKL